MINLHIARNVLQVSRENDVGSELLLIGTPTPRIQKEYLHYVVGSE